MAVTWSAFAVPPELTQASAPLRRDSLRASVRSLDYLAGTAGLAVAHAKRERRLAGCQGRFSTLPRPCSVTSRPFNVIRAVKRSRCSCATIRLTDVAIGMAVRLHSRDLRTSAFDGLRFASGVPNSPLVVKHGEIGKPVHAQGLQFGRRLGCAYTLLIHGADTGLAHSWTARSDQYRVDFVQRNHLVQVMAIERRTKSRVQVLWPVIHHSCADSPR